MGLLMPNISVMAVFIMIFSFAGQFDGTTFPGEHPA
jgi:hypothetical protein